MSERIPEPPSLEDVPIVYTNLLRAIPSPFEFGLDFGYIVPSPRTELPRQMPKAQVRVVMSWEYAKVLRDLLQEVIETREGNVGEIKRPPGLERVEVEVEADQT